MMTRSCTKCHKFLPAWDTHRKCARHRSCRKTAPCFVCRVWDSSVWDKLSAWLVRHPAPPKQVGLVQGQGLSGSFSDSALPSRPSPSQDLGNDSYEPLELYASSSSEDDSSSHRAWLQDGSDGRSKTASRDQVRAPVGCAPRADPPTIGPSQSPVGFAPRLEKGPGETRHSSNPLGSARERLWLCAHPHSLRPRPFTRRNPLPRRLRDQAYLPGPVSPVNAKGLRLGVPRRPNGLPRLPSHSMIPKTPWICSNGRHVSWGFPCTRALQARSGGKTRGFPRTRVPTRPWTSP